MRTWGKYLEDRTLHFWAKTKNEELTNPGLTALRIVRIEDVSQAVFSGTSSKNDLVKIQENIKKLEEFKSINSRFNDQNLELIKAKFDAQKSGNDTLLSQLKKDSDNLMRRKYLYAINFAMNNKDSEIAPYIALSEIYNAKVTFLDTIYNALSNNIANSKYGLQLEEFIQERKKEDSIK